MKKILINDSTLMSQNNAMNLSFKEKLEIVKRIANLGVDVISLPCPQNKTDEVLIKTVATCVNSTILSVNVGLTENSVEKVNELVSKVKNKQLSVSVPVSPIQMEYFVSKKPDAVIKLIETLVVKSKSLSSNVELCLEDVTRAEVDFVAKAIKSGITSGATAICLKDCAGTMLPDDFNKFIEKLFELSPKLKNVELYVAFNDSYSLSVALSLASIKCGISGIKTSAINSTNCANIERIISGIQYIYSKDGYETGVKTSTLHSVVAQINGFINSKTNAVNGQAVKGEEIKNDVTIEELSSIVKSLGYGLSIEDMAKVYEEYKRLATKKTVTTKELDVIIASTALQVKETYELVSFSVNTSNVLDATASIVLQKDGEKISGLSFGNGPVDASFLALEQIIGRHFELDDYELSSVTEGKEAMGQAIIRLRNNGVVYSGRGVSTDVVGASIRAYLNAVNKIFCEEND